MSGGWAPPTFAYINAPHVLLLRGVEGEHEYAFFRNLLQHIYIMKKTLFTLFAAGSLMLASFEKEADGFNYALDADNSLVEWSGASPKSSHQGSFAVSSQGLEVVDGMVRGGSFTIPIASIKNYDLAKVVKPVLLKHLKSQDFFNMAVYPEASFTITSVETLSDSVAGAIAGANVLVSGDFTMIGTTHPISFPARVAVEGDGLSAEAQFKLDRTQWGMTYAADTTLEDRHIYPEVDIHLKLTGIKK